jgi:hypothetical protein
MTRPVVVGADPIDVTRARLLSAPEMGPWSGRVFLTDPRDVLSSPWLRFGPVGGGFGAADTPAMEIIQMDFLSFAPPGRDASRAAHQLARTARAVILASVGFSADGGTITAVQETIGLAYSPDTTRTPAYPCWVNVMTLTIFTRS